MDWNLVVTVGFGLITVIFIILLGFKYYYRMKEIEKELEENGELSEGFAKDWGRNLYKETRYFIVFYILIAILFILYYLFINEQ